MSAVDKLNEFLRHAVDRDLPLPDLLALKAEALEACALDSRVRGDLELAEAEGTAARHAREAAACAAGDAAMATSRPGGRW